MLSRSKRPVDRSELAVLFYKFLPRGRTQKWLFAFNVHNRIYTRSTGKRILNSRRGHCLNGRASNLFFPLVICLTHVRGSEHYVKASGISKFVYFLYNRIRFLRNQKSVKAIYKLPISPRVRSNSVYNLERRVSRRMTYVKFRIICSLSKMLY